MAYTTDIFQYIYNQTDPVITTLVADKYGAIVDVVRGPLLVGITIYIVAVGYAVMRGVASEPWGHLLSSMVRLAILWLAVTSFYGVWVAQASVGIPNQLTAAVGGSANPGAALDSFVNSVSNNVITVIKNAPPMWDNEVMGRADNIVDQILGGVVGLVAFTVAGIALAIMLFAKLALAIVVVFGPIFVALLLFDSTRGMFFGWLGHALHYVFLIAIIALLVSFLSGVILTTCQAIGSQIPAKGGDNNIPYLFALIAMMGILIVGGFIFMQAPGIANMAGGGGGGGGVALAAAALVGARSIAARSGRAGSSGSRRSTARPAVAPALITSD
jgi:type IV secretion system protein VirB6